MNDLELEQVCGGAGRIPSVKGVSPLWDNPWTKMWVDATFNNPWAKATTAYWTNAFAAVRNFAPPFGSPIFKGPFE